MICFPNAKINLGLSVTEKRPDGMHNIETCFVPVPMYDVLEIQPSGSFSLKLFGLPLPDKLEDNLIVKAWNILLSVKKNIKPVEVYLYKNIPGGSGLGGGSSNAAFFLKSMNSFFSLGFSNPDLELLAAEIGADAPFFINNKAAIATETGNIFHLIENPVYEMHITVVFPNIHISSKDAFAKVIPVKKSNLTNVLKSNISNWKNYLKNDFEEIIFRDFPETRNIKNHLYSSGAEYVSLSGSGSSIYALSTRPLYTEYFIGKYKIWTGVVK
ncbi:MAG: 4-(cytidine 5'-diphospho)-2-C-methyl-D-erythritol kinase [Bacteroidetes bacterium]|nr:4-(cytidine 5'-diphospho)-2-C-methyl-D-erythritol kinase [Bacteroidota bacterium]